MVDVLLLWSKADGADVEDELLTTLLAIMKEARGLERLRMSDGELMARGGPPPFARVVEASFKSLPDWMAAVDALNSQPDLAASDRMPLVIFFEARDA